MLASPFAPAAFGRKLLVSDAPLSGHFSQSLQNITGLFSCEEVEPSGHEEEPCVSSREGRA